VNPLIWGLLWFICGGLIGVLAYFTWGLFTLPVDALDRISHARAVQIRNRAANYYSKMAMKLLERAALVERGTKFDLFSTSKTGDRNVDKIKIDGETGHVANDTGLLGTLHKKPFGLLSPPEENVASYVSPELAEFGRLEQRRREHDSHRTDDGSYDPDVELSWRRPGVKLRDHVRTMIPGNRSLWDIAETEKFVEQSKSAFTSPNTQQYMVLIIAYSAGALLTWLIVTNAGGTAPTGISVPGMG
jgi:hypothetical protein